MAKTEKKPTDEELIARIKTGDEEAENEIFSRYKDLVTKISRGYFLMGGELEDITQEGMIGLYKAVKNYNPVSNATFKTYAIVCIKHQIQTAIKRANALKNAPLSSAISLQNYDSSGEEFLPVELIFTDTPDAEVIDRENLFALRDTIKKLLSPTEIEVLRQYLQGFSYREIAEKIDRTPKAVDNILARAKSKLKTHFQK